MGEAGHLSSQFRRAVDNGDFHGARLLLVEMPSVGLENALALTLLAADTEAARFGPMARRWLVRLVEGREPPLPDLAIVTQLLADVDEGRLVPSKATEPLSRVARGLRLG